MKILEIKALSNGAHRNQGWDKLPIPDGWAVIPEAMEPLENFPFGEVTAEEVTHYRERTVEQEVTKTREVEAVDEEGNPITTTEEYTEMAMVIVREPYGVMTVTGWVPGVMPEPEPEADSAISLDDRVNVLEEENAMLKAQISAQSDQMDFYENCIAEMAMVVYA